MGRGEYPGSKAGGEQFAGLLDLDKLKKGMYQGEIENLGLGKRREEAVVNKLKGSNKRNKENAEK